MYYVYIMFEYMSVLHHLFISLWLFEVMRKTFWIFSKITTGEFEILLSAVLVDKCINYLIFSPCDGFFSLFLFVVWLCFYLMSSFFMSVDTKCWFNISKLLSYTLSSVTRNGKNVLQNSVFFGRNVGWRCRIKAGHAISLISCVAHVKCQSVFTTARKVTENKILCVFFRFYQEKNVPFVILFGLKS